ncbi:retrotransposon protein, putative, unclassified [Panicum miliaceum]|uniref:Retrotransposon protein, putative, unclassified n=1 Tax=Panicum miliaceum TaxID=4540 RepID=A0A3L6SUM8_PANMI|nr:retrotransposon protein, putative, unclassified [Panicum miliaceum]
MGRLLPSIPPWSREEMLEASHKRYLSRPARDFSKFSTKPPIQPDKGVLGTAPVEAKKDSKSRWNDRVANLRTVRRAKGECMRCGEKYSPGHRCPTSVPLQVIEEMFDVLQLEDDSAVAEDVDSDTSAEDAVLSLSFHATAGYCGKENHQTPWFSGQTRDPYAGGLRTWGQFY